MKLLLAIIICLNLKGHASVPETFGAGAAAMAIGNQAERESAANHYYAAALQGFSTTTQLSLSAFYVDTDFHRISNVVIENHTNTINRTTRGDPEVNQTPLMMFGANLSLPLFSPEGPKFLASLFAPFDRTMEADTGEPYQPKYVMYGSRNVRSVMMFSLTQSFGNWSYALGSQTGFQSNGDAYFMTRTVITEKPSQGRIRFNAKPAMGLTASVARKADNSMSYLSFQQEMKARLLNQASGETEIAGEVSLPYEFDVTSVLYFDPMIFRLGHQSYHSQTDFFYALEFQRWSSYETSMLQLKQRSGEISGSINYEQLQLRNIFIPRIGMVRRLTDRWSAKAGYFYRPSPIKPAGLAGAGNTIDVNKHVVGLGASYNLPFQGKVLVLDAAYQGHLLEYQRIRKTPYREDGTLEQDKIGSPGYAIGGMVHAISLGLSWKI
jgi:hypothetical protein